MANFPTLGNKEDSAQWGVEYEDVGKRSEMEGGYVLTRPRHTRRPRRTFTTGFTDISNSEKTTIENFFYSHGTYKAFDYTLPFGGGVVNVRFKEPITPEFAGWPNNPRWNIQGIKLEEV